MPERRIFLFLLLIGVMPWSAAIGATRTGKERLGDKASDEQRVNDCKVPASRRTRPRPDACPPVPRS
jgi:hypothetical protein